jgi:hypothetical protein
MVVYLIIFFLICKTNSFCYFFLYIFSFCRNSNQHVQPFVLVQFTSLALDQQINIQCRAWAPNIEQLSQGTTSRGLVTFSLLRSSKTGPYNT